MDDEERRMMRLADVLLPGDDLFPAASASGMAGLLLARMRGAGGDLIGRVLVSVGEPSVDTVARLAAAEPDLFDSLRKIVFVTYYEQELVVDAIRALGMPYNHAPLPAGYLPEPFDPATDAPRYRRGGWVATDAVLAADLSGLAHLGSGR